MKYRPTPLFLLLRRLAISIDKNGLFGSIRDACRRTITSIGRRGLSGTVKLVTSRPPKTPEEVAVMPPHAFDLLHGIDTGGYIRGVNLSAVSLSGLYITAYGSIMPSVLTQALSELPIRYEDFAFVDIGCGKGRALFVAAEFPFRHLLGVEIASELADVAQANASTNPDWAARISIVNQDAATVTLPDGPLLLFLYNPFLASVLRRFLRNLERQLRRSPRPTYLLYALNPRFTKVLDSFPFLKELSDKGYSFCAETDTTGVFSSSEERFTLYSADFTR